MSRRNFLIIIGEEFDSETGEGADMDDNVRNQIKVEAKDQVVKLLEVVEILDIYTKSFLP
jgi:ATP-dependent DNA helicase RecQ